MSASHGAPNGAHLFSLAVVADTHMNEEEAHCSSPFEVNRLANARTRWVVAKINELDPAFTIHLGDLIHPVPALASYAQAAKQFHDLTGALKAPLHLVPGNHDVGDKPIDWGPAGIIRDEYIAKWREHFGDDYYHFDYEGCRFVVLNAQLFNSGLEEERRQLDWLQSLLSERGDKRDFWCLHYPPYARNPSSGGPCHSDQGWQSRCCL